MERSKRWRALTFLLVAFLSSSAVLSAHSAAAVAVAVVCRGPSCNGSDVECQAGKEEEEAEFHFGSEIEWGIMEVPQQLAYGSLGPEPICNPGSGNSYGGCLGAVNKYQPPPCPNRKYFRC